MLSPVEITKIEAEIDELEKALADCSDSNVRRVIRIGSRNRRSNCLRRPELKTADCFMTD